VTTDVRIDDLRELVRKPPRHGLRRVTCWRCGRRRIQARPFEKLCRECWPVFAAEWNATIDEIRGKMEDEIRRLETTLATEASRKASDRA